MPIVGYGSVERTYLQAVNKVIKDTGKGEVATLAGPSRHVSIAMSAVEDARDRVFYKTKWDFRRAFFEITLVEFQVWYELPADYQRLASPISLNRTTGMITYMEYEDMLLNWPDLRMFPPGSGVGGILSLTQALAQTHNMGESNTCTSLNGYIALLPVPNDTFVDREGILYATYWKQAPPLTADISDIGLPRELWECAHLLALGKFKKALEYSDWETDWADGMRELRKESGESRDPQDNNVYHEQSINYNE